MTSIAPEKLSYLIRKTSAEMICNAKSSHIGGVFSCADILAILFGEVLRRDPSDFHDSFILSKGHCCSGVYAALFLTGYLSKADIDTYALDGSNLMAHISHKVDHIDFSTGSLGHGLSHGIGKSLAFKKSRIDKRIFVLLSDGELGEGSNWEAIFFAGYHKLDNITAIIDYNKLQSLTTTFDTLDLEPLVDKFEAFNWQTVRLDGHSLPDLRSAFKSPGNGKPRVIICDTIKGFPISFMQNRVEWHYKPPSSAQLLSIVEELKEFYS